MWLKQIWRCNTKSERSKGRDRNAVRRPRLETRSWVGHERILSIHPNNKADSDQNFHVDVCYHHARHGVAVYRVTGGDTFSSVWRLPGPPARAWPSCAGWASTWSRQTAWRGCCWGTCAGPAQLCAVINWRSQHVLRFCSDWWRMPVILWSISTLYLIMFIKSFFGENQTSKTQHPQTEQFVNTDATVS